MSSLSCVISITERRMREKFINVYKKRGVEISFTALGKGTAAQETLDYFGLSATEKAVIFAIATPSAAQGMLRDAEKELMIDVPGNGIVMVAPLSAMIGRDTYQLLTKKQDAAQEGEMHMENCGFELIIAIANEGSTDTLMDAARAVGATGGTILRTKGTGLAHAEKFRGVSLAEEKEMLLIVAATEKRNPIMTAITKQAQSEDGTRTIVFSMPLSRVEGLRLLDEAAQQAGPEETPAP